ncbi:MAG: hypothetical protein QGG48_12895, partial [Desulfatiglandales bacterium]|nr:hypothetical protein [Desulfatiglandales bacterium]
AGLTRPTSPEGCGLWLLVSGSHFISYNRDLKSRSQVAGCRCQVEKLGIFLPDTSIPIPASFQAEKA